MEQNNNEVLAVLDVCNRIYNLKSGNYTIGRDTEEFRHDICINNASVDVKHSALEMRLYGAKIIDLFSKNGTFVDGEDIGKFNFFDIYKSVGLKFGDVCAQFRLTAESDSGFLGLNTSRDVSGIIPQSPQEFSTVRQNSEISGRSRLRAALGKSHLSVAHSSNTSEKTDQSNRPNSPMVVPSTQSEGHQDIFANVTDENIRKNIEKMEEEDDFYVPETQEIFEKRKNSLDNQSQAFVRLCTQEFEDVDEKSNDSDNLLGDLNSSLIIPYIRHSPIAVREIKEEKGDAEKTADNNAKEINEVSKNTNTETKSRNNAINDDDYDTDAEEEMSNLNWSESRIFNLTRMNLLEDKSASVTPDLDLNVVAQEIDASVTPDLELEGEKSGSVTPDLDLPPTRESEADYDNFTPTQPFILNKINTSTSNQQKKSNSINVSPSNKENLDETQLFILDKSRCSLDASADNSLKNLDDSVFLKPSFLPKAGNAVSTPRCNMASKSNLLLEPTQPFEMRTEQAEPSNQEEENQELFYLEATQPFHFEGPVENNTRGSSSPCLLESDDEENNSEFCFKETLVVGEEKERNDNNLEEKADANKTRINETRGRTKKRFKSKSSRSRSKSTPKAQTAADDNLFSDIQATPNVDFLQLPNTCEIKKAGKLFNEMTKGQRRNKILLEESSSDNSSSEDDTNNEDKQNTLDTANKNIKHPLIKLNKADINKMIQKINVEKNTSPSSSKDSLNKLKENEKKVKKHNSKPKPENISLLKSYDSPPKLRKTRSRNAKLKQSTTKTEIRRNSDSNKYECLRNKVEEVSKIPEKQEKSPYGLRKSSELETKSSDGDSPATVSKLVRRTSGRLKSMPVYMVEDYFMDKDFQSTETDDSKPSTRGHKKSVRSADSEALLKTKEDKILKRDERKTTVTENECLEVREKRPRTRKATSRDKGDTADSDNSTRTSRRKIDTLKSTEPEKSSRTTERSTNKKQTEEKDRASGNSKKRSSGSTDQNDIEARKKVKTNSSGMSRSVSESELQSTEIQGLRRSTRQAKHRIAFTRVDSTSYRSAIRKVGAKVVDNPRECTVLVAEKVIRTWKFLAAMAMGVPIVSPKWLDNIHKTSDDSFSYDDYIVKDLVSEKHYKFTLKKSLHLARRKPIFKGYEFLLTPNIKPTPPEMIQIIECGGGKILLKLPKDQLDHSHFYVVSGKEDVSLWPKFRRAIPGVQIISTEAVMLSVIQQCIRFKDYLLS